MTARADNEALDALRSVYDAEPSRRALCETLGMRSKTKGGRFWCPSCQPTGASDHKTPDFSTEGGFRCHKCAWTGDAFGLVQAVKGGDFNDARAFLEELNGQPARTRPGRNEGFGWDDPIPIMPRKESPKARRKHTTAEAAALAMMPAGFDRMTLLHNYRDPNGAPALAVARYDGAEGKTYRPFHPTADGWKSGDPPGPLPLYRLPELLAADPALDVYLVEGEKCADAAAAVGLVATCWAHGVGAVAKTDWSPLAGRRVVLLPDADAVEKTPQAIRERLCEGFPPLVESLDVVSLPIPAGHPKAKKYDVADLIEDAAADADGHDHAEKVRAGLEALTIQARARTAGTGKRDARIVDAGDWIEAETPEADAIISDVFDAGDKVALMGSSKMRKTFFALQLALSVASGRPFLGWQIPKARRVLFLQCEVKADHFQKRVKRMCAAMGIGRADLSGRLCIWNARGERLARPKDSHSSPASQKRANGDAAMRPPADPILSQIERHRAEYVILDPLYKLVEGDENKAEDVKPFLARLDAIAEASGAAAHFVHHNAKGTAGDKDARDRGAGSGVLARDFDAALYLTEHAQGEPLAVVETLKRNYAPSDAFVVEFRDGCFHRRDDLPAIVRTSKTKATKTAAQATPEGDAEMVAAMTEGGPLNAGAVDEWLSARGYSVRQQKQARSRLCAGGLLSVFTPPLKPRRDVYGTPAQIAEMRLRYGEQQALEDTGNDPSRN